jgi:hypothetical protein
MTVADLIHALQRACDGEPEDSVEVRLAFQPNWPFEYSIDDGPGITIVEVQNDAYERHDKIIYLPEGQQLGYLPGVASKALGWRG